MNYSQHFSTIQFMSQEKDDSEAKYNPQAWVFELKINEPCLKRTEN